VLKACDDADTKLRGLILVSLYISFIYVSIRHDNKVVSRRR
jgi:hypothetical protein